MYSPQTSASRCKSTSNIKNTKMSTHSTSTTTSGYKNKSTVSSRPLQRGSNTALGNSVTHSYQKSIHGYGSVFAVTANWWRRCRTRPRDSGLWCQVGYKPADQGEGVPPAPEVPCWGILGPHPVVWGGRGVDGDVGISRRSGHSTCSAVVVRERMISNLVPPSGMPPYSHMMKTAAFKALYFCRDFSTSSSPMC